MERTSNSVPVYGGDKPYIFISYSHKDSDRVIPFIVAMESLGYRVWFDQGIEAGSEWSNNIANHLRSCAAFVSFVSANSMSSENCLDEIAFAKSNNKPSLMIFLEESVSLPTGVEMQTARFQRLFWLSGESADSFVKQLKGAPLISPCRGEDAYDFYKSSGGAGVPSHTTDRKKNKRKLAFEIGAAVVAAVLICIMAILLVNSNKSVGEPADSDPPAESTPEPFEPSVTQPKETPDETEPPEITPETEAPEVSETPPETEPPRTEIEMSDDLTDLTFVLDGRVYALPMYYPELLEDGWQVIAGAGEAHSDTIVYAHVTEEIRLFKGLQEITAVVYNPSGNARLAVDCIMMGIYVAENGNADFSIAKGICIGSSKAEFADAFGEPVHANISYDVYLSDDPDKSRVFVYYTEEKCSGIRLWGAGKLKNEPTDTNTAVPPCVEEYEAPTELGNDIFTGRFQLFDGMIAQLPVPLSLFLENGWTTDTDLSAYTIMSGKHMQLYIYKEGVTVSVVATNLGPWQNILKNSMVTAITVETSGVDDRKIITLAGGICTGSTYEELEDKLPSDRFRVYETDTQIVYVHVPASNNYGALVEEIAFRFDKTDSERPCCQIDIRYK